MNDLIKSHDMYDAFDTQFPLYPSHSQPGQYNEPRIQRDTNNTHSSHQSTPSGYNNHLSSQRPPVDPVALQNMLMEIQDIERRLHILFHSVQRLMQYSSHMQLPPVPQYQYPTPQLPPFQSNTTAMDQLRTGYMQYNGTPTASQVTTHRKETLGTKEGVFDGEQMISADGDAYKVTGTFAANEGLIEGDLMKALIYSDGTIDFEVIEKGDRENIMGILSTHAANSPYYIVQTAQKAYKVLKESVSKNNASPGNQVRLIIPLGGESEWATIDTVFRTN